jgi:hypothetical protein
MERILFLLTVAAVTMNLGHSLCLCAIALAANVVMQFWPLSYWWIKQAKMPGMKVVGIA